jgi:hypothetical protein
MAEVTGKSRIKALHYLHGKFRWASTSMDSRGMKHICEICIVKHPTYEPGRPFFRGVLGEFLADHMKGMVVNVHR